MTNPPVSEDTASIAALAEVNQTIASAAKAVSRQAENVVLVAVSKTFSADQIRPVLGAGHRHFGENRVQEAAAKWPDLRADFPDTVLHLIGPLQTNKIAEALALFDVIHTVDRPKLARKLAAEMVRMGKSPDLFVQVNTGLEEQKAGVAPQETVNFVHQCKDEWGLTISGLMCIPPVNQDPAPHFALLAKLAKEAGVANLSMGMSADYASALRLGATHVRVGSAIFGARD